MEDIRKYLRDYIETKEKIFEAVTDVLDNNKTEHIAARDHMIHGNEELMAMFRRQINIRKDKRFYNDEKSKFKYAVEYLYRNKRLVTTVDVARSFEIPTSKLSAEYKKYIELRRFYVYDKFTSNGENKKSVFTFAEEDSLMQKLRNVKEKVLKDKKGCCCWFCTMILLPYIAYNFAKDKGKMLPQSWDLENEKVDENWLNDFEMRHAEELVKNFRVICSKSPDLPACHLRKCLKPSICYANMQRCSDSPHISEVSDEIKSEERKKLKDHLSMYKRIEPAVSEVIDGGQEQEVVARTHRIDQHEKNDFMTTIDIIRKKKQHIIQEEKLRAIFQFFFNRVTEEVDRNNFDLQTIWLSRGASLYKIDDIIAITEYRLRMKSITPEQYKYNKKIEDKSTALIVEQVDFTYDEQFELLGQLCLKKDELICKCQICASELLATLVEKYIQSTRGVSNIWIISTAKSYWLYLFIIRHRETFFKNFPKDDCEEDMIFECLESKFKSVFSSTEKESQSCTSRSSRKRKLDSTQTSEDQTSQIHTDSSETSTILKWHKRLHRAAKRIIEGENHEDIANEYNFDPETREKLNTKIGILKKKNKYIERKNKIEETLEAIDSGKMTLDEAKNTTGIKSVMLDREHEKFKKSKNEGKTYEYDKPTSKNAIFTFTEEFSFLKTLMKEKEEGDHPRCWCYACLKFCLSNVILGNEMNKTVDFSSENKETTREKWWSEFEMRHYKKIKKILSPDTNPNVSNPLCPEQETAGPSSKICHRK